MFKIFKAMVEKESGRFIKFFRSHRIGEYMSNKFMEFCQYSRIKRQFTAHYTPQQNGVAERMNRTIMNMVQNMMKEKHLSDEYWGDVTFSVYILNRSPTKSVKD